jgi:PAS domain S-box-containing protein
MAASPAGSVEALFGGSDEIRSLCRAIDWGATPLGRVETWPEPLRAAIRICLDATSVPMGVCAGRDLTLIYNESYARLLGRSRHPRAMGRAAREVWWECWGRVGEDLRLVMEEGAGIHREDEPVLIRRDDGTEEAFFTYSFTPVRTGSGEVVAALTVVHDTTARVRAARCSTEFLSFALSTAGTGVWELNLSDHSARRSALHTRIFGCDDLRPAWSYESFLEHVVAEDRARVDQTFRDAVESERDWAFECGVVGTDGETRRISAVGRHVADESGSPRRMVGVVQDVTDRRHAEEQLRISEAQLKFAQEAAGAGMWHWDLGTGQMVWSDQLYRLFGLDPATDAPASLDRWRQVVHPDDRAQAERDLNASISDRGLILNEHRIVLPSGEVRWINALGRTTGDADGQAHVSGICVDVTERRRTEESLRASEALARERLAELEALYETAPIGLCVFDDHLRWVRANKVIAEINGRPVAEHIGRTPREVVPDVGAQAEDALRTILETGERLDFEMTGTTAAAPGVERSWAEHWVPIKDQTGRITGISVAAEEITERKRTARALAESETRFRSLADAMPQIVWSARPDGVIDYCNERVKELSGTGQRDDGTWSWEGALDPEDARRTLDGWTDALHRGHAYEISHRLTRFDGTVHWYLTRAVPVRNETGRIVQWFGTTTDIDAQKRAEEAVRETDRHKSEFLALLSHELRNPLAVARTSLALIQRAGPESPQAKRALLVLDRQVSHIVRLLDDLLDVTRISLGKLLLQPESVELNGIVLTTGEDQSALFHAEGIDLRVTVCARPLRVHGDAARIAQAIRNLLQNAAKFTPRGGVVTLSLDADDRGGAVVAVSDSGVGIPPDASVASSSH